MENQEGRGSKPEAAKQIKFDLDSSAPSDVPQSLQGEGNAKAREQFRQSRENLSNGNDQKQPSKLSGKPISVGSDFRQGELSGTENIPSANGLVLTASERELVKKVRKQRAIERNVEKKYRGR